MAMPTINPILDAYFKDQNIDPQKKANLARDLDSGKIDESGAVQVISSKYPQVLQAGASNVAGQFANTVMNQKELLGQAASTFYKSMPGVLKVGAEMGSKVSPEESARMDAVSQSSEDQQKINTDVETQAVQYLNSVGITPDGTWSPEIKINLAKQVMDNLKIPGPYGDVGTGVAKGTLNTVMGASELVARGLQAVTEVATGPNAETTKSIENIKKFKEKVTIPQNIPEAVGYIVEQIGEFIVPGGIISKAEKGAVATIQASKLPNVVKSASGLGAVMGIEGLSAGLIAAAQTGNVDQGVMTTATISAAVPALSKFVKWAVSPFKNPAKMSASSAEIAKVIKPNKNSYLFGKNPAQAIVDEGIIANNMDDLAKQVAAKKAEVGKLIAENIDDAMKASDQTVDLTKIIQNNADDYAAQVTDKAAWKTYADRVSQATGTFKADLATGELVKTGAKDLANSTADDVWRLQQKVGELAQWTNAVGEKAANKQLHKLYYELGKQLDNMAEGTKALQLRYSNLLGAQKAIQDRAAVIVRNTGIMSLGIGGAAGSLTAPISSGMGQDNYVTRTADFLIGALALKARNSTAFRTRFAQFLNVEAKIPKEKAAEVVKGIIKWGVNEAL